MSRIFTALATVALLAGCDSTNPFQLDATAPTGETEALEPNDPNTDVNSKFAFNLAESLTMNSVEYDAANDELIINNLPFDGPDGRYDAVAGTETTSANGLRQGIYESRQTATTGQIKHYAVFIQGDYMNATSTAGRNWVDFGNAGANINRSDFALPTGAGVGDGEYVYVGVYAGTRTYDERSGLELITGDVRLLLDISDFDVDSPGDGLQGAIVGTITNRVRSSVGDTMLGDLPNISLFEVSFNTETGVWDEGTVATYYNGDIRDSGTHSGLIAGPVGEEMGGYVVMQGVADIQTVTYQIVEWNTLDDTGNVISSGTTTGLQLSDPDVLQNGVNFGVAIGTLTVSASDLPDGAVITSTTTDTVDIATEFNAREIGIFVTDQE